MFPEEMHLDYNNLYFYTKLLQTSLNPLGTTFILILQMRKLSPKYIIHSRFHSCMSQKSRALGTHSPIHPSLRIFCDSRQAFFPFWPSLIGPDKGPAWLKSPGSSQLKFLNFQGHRNYFALCTLASACMLEMKGKGSAPFQRELVPAAGLKDGHHL